MSDTAKALYGAPAPVEQPTEQPAIDARSFAEVLFDNTVETYVSQSVSEAVDRGVVLPADADKVARDLTRELRAVGLDHSDSAALVRTIGQPPLDAAAAQRAVGATNRLLHEEFGAAAQRLLGEANAWLAKVAPGLHGSLADSRASTDPTAVLNIVRAYRRAARR